MSAERLMAKDPVTGKILFNHPFFGKTNIRPKPGTRVRRIDEPVVNTATHVPHRLTLKAKTNAQAIQNRRHTGLIDQMGNMTSYVAAKEKREQNRAKELEAGLRSSNQYQQSKNEERTSMNRMAMINEGRENRRTSRERANLVAASYNRVAASKAMNQQGGRHSRTTRKRRHSSFRLKNNK